MSNKIRYLYFLLAGLILGTAISQITDHSRIEKLGANSQYGLSCIYTSSTRTLANGTGTAFSCDNQGRIILTN